MGKIKPMIIAKFIAFGMLIVICPSCPKQNPFYPSANITVDRNPTTVTLTYTIDYSPQIGYTVYLEYPTLQLTFSEIYGGTYAKVESIEVEYTSPNEDTLIVLPDTTMHIDSILPLRIYRIGTNVYVPPGEETMWTLNIVRDRLEDLFTPDLPFANADPGYDYDGVIYVNLRIYGVDGNDHIFEVVTYVTVQRLVIGGD